MHNSCSVVIAVQLSQIMFTRSHICRL